MEKPYFFIETVLQNELVSSFHDSLLNIEPKLSNNQLNQIHNAFLSLFIHNVFEVGTSDNSLAEKENWVDKIKKIVTAKITSEIGNQGKISWASLAIQAALKNIECIPVENRQIEGIFEDVVLHNLKEFGQSFYPLIEPTVAEIVGLTNRDTLHCFADEVASCTKNIFGRALRKDSRELDNGGLVIAAGSQLVKAVLIEAKENEKLIGSLEKANLVNEAHAMVVNFLLEEPSAELIQPLICGGLLEQLYVAPNQLDTTRLRELWNTVVSLGSEGPSEPALGICCICLDAFHSQLHIPLQGVYWNCLNASLSHSNSLIRKRALHMLQYSLVFVKDQLAAQNNRYCDFQEQQSLFDSQKWQLFVDTLGTLETEFQIHIVEQVWPVVVNLCSSLSKNIPTSIGPEDPVPPALSFGWIRLLFERVIFADSMALRKTWVRRLLRGEGVPVCVMKPCWVVHKLLEALDDSYWFGSDSFSEDISIFLAHFAALSSDEHKIELLQNLVQTIKNGHLKTNMLLTAVVEAFLQDEIKLASAPAIDPKTLCILRSALTIRLPSINNFIKRSLLKGFTAMVHGFMNYSDSRWDIINDVAAFLSSYPSSMLKENHYELVEWASKIQPDEIHQEHPEFSCWFSWETSKAVGYFLQEATDEKNLNECLPKSKAKALVAIIPLVSVPEERKLILLPMVQVFSRAYSSPYISRVQVNRALLLLQGLCEADQITLTEIAAGIDELLSFLCAELINALNEEYSGHPLFCDNEDQRNLFWEKMTLYTKVLGDITSLHSRSQQRIDNAVFDMLNMSCLPILGTSNKKAAAQYQKVLALDVVCACLQAEVEFLVPCEKVAEGEELCSLLIQAVMNVYCRRTGPALLIMNWGHLAALHARLKWKALSKLFLHSQNSKDGTLHKMLQSGNQLEDAISAMEDALMDSVKVSLPDVLFCFARILPIHILSITKDDEKDHVQELQRLLEVAWLAVRDIRRKSWAIIVAFTNLVFQPAFLEQPDFNQPEGPLKSFFSRIMAEGMARKPVQLRYLIVYCCTIWRENPITALPYIDEIVQILMFKEPILNPNDVLNIDPNEEDDLGIEFEGAFEDLNFSLLTEQSTSTKAPPLSFARVILLIFIEGLFEQRTNVNVKMLTDQLIFKLLDINLTEDFKRAGITNSKPYGRKLKTWQALCILCKFIHGEAVLDKINQLFWDVHQFLALSPIRQCMEVFGVFLIENYTKESLPYLLKELSQWNHRGQVLCSLLIIAGYVIQKDRDTNHSILTASQRKDLLQAILPWLGCAQGYSRIISQLIAFYAIPEFIGADENYLQSVIAFLSENKEMMRMREKQSGFFKEMNPNRLLTVKGLLQMGIDENLEFNPKHLTDLLAQAMSNHYQDFYGPSTESTKEDPSKNILEDVEGRLNIQRKILPWDQLDLAYEDAWRSHHSNAVGNIRSQIIVCASLIDKVPNLAGLARTCEIFAAEKLVIPNIKLIEHDTFEKVSVTAHQWIPIEEVQPPDLLEFLRSCKANGYTVVGLEQTSNSTILTETQFSAKTVLLLGKEKEGIPVDLLQEIDQCTEIPQLGVIRSLNVHVSGAITLWEYTKQHRLQFSHGMK